MPTLNWKYGCHHPLDWAPDVDDQLRKQVELWNRLCEIEEANRAEYRRIIGEDQVVAALESEVEAFDTQLQGLLDERKARRTKARRKAGVSDDIDGRIKELAATLKDLRGRLREARKAAREAVKTPLGALEERRRELVKEARKEAAAAGLWWGHYNAVMAAYDQARQKVMKTGGGIRRRHHDGTGRLTIQFQGGVTPEDLFAGARCEARIEPAPRQTRKWHHLVLTAYAQGRAMRRTVTLPIAIHRPFPAGALIKSLTLTIRRVAPGQLRYEAVFSVSTPDEQSDETTNRPLPTAAVNIGWRATTAGLRIATLADTRGHTEHVTLPPEIVDRLSYCEDLQGDIDEEADAYFTHLRRLDWPEAAEDDDDAFQQAVTKFRRARRPHPRHLVRLVACWPDDWEAERKADIQDWLHRDLRERRRLNQTRGKALRRRKDWMRKLVAGWLRRYGHIIVDDFSVAKAGTIDPVDDTASAAVRHQARIAAPGELRAWIKDAGPRAGVLVTEQGGRITATCHACGAPASVAADQIMHRCTSCRTLWDRDENACRNMLSANTMAAA